MRAARLVAFLAAVPMPRAMALRTRFTQRLRSAPIVLAPMGGCAGGRLAAAVSAAGGVGLVGSGGESLDFLRREWALALSAPAVERDRLGFGLNVGQLDGYAPGTLEALLEELGPKHVYLSFGDVAPYAQTVKGAGATLYSNCGDSAGAVAHAAAGVDVVVAQGSDAGGHTHPRASVFALVPQCRTALDAAGHGDALLIASGGVADGRGLAAALLLGADAAVLGTTLTVAEESTYAPSQKQAVVETRCGAAGTTIGTFIDAVRGIDDHSSGLPGRCVVNKSTGLEAAYREADDADRERLRAEHAAGVRDAGGEGLEWGATWAGAACGLVTSVRPAAVIIESVLDEAAATLGRGAELVT